jgi:hypothetical protein
MTIEEIKKNLPTVKVKCFNTIVPAKISGRQLKYPIVHTSFLGTNLSWEFSWSAIEHAINTDSVLIV